MGESTSYIVRTDAVPAKPFSGLARQATRDDLVPTLLASIGEAWDRIRAEGYANTGRNVAVYRDCTDGLIEFQAGVEILEGGMPPADELLWTPVGQAAWTVHTGDYGGLSQAHGAILDWAKTNGVELAGPNWEIYGHWNEDPAKLTTEVYYLVGPESGV